MNTVRQTIAVNATVAKVFAAYVDRIDDWWPRQGERFRYSFAPKGVEPDHIRFEPKVGGRLYEIFADGNEYTIGLITVWEPPNSLPYTWKDPSWDSDTLIEITLTAVGDGTMLTLSHTGFEALGIPEAALGYKQGTIEIYGIFKAWIEANATLISAR